MNILFNPFVLIGHLLLSSATGLVDAGKIAAHADSVGVPREVAWALAWKESRTGVRGNTPRGPGRWGVDAYGNVIRICREVGRFQLSPCHDYTKTDPRCTQKALRASLDDNIHCGLVWYREKVRTLCSGDLVCGVERYNGSGPKARKYRDDALAYIGRFTLLLRQRGYDLGQNLPPLAGSD